MNIMPDEALDAALSIGEYSSRSDAACKEALACKEVLVRILQGCVPEYRNCTEEEIAACIEGQPLVGELPVDRDLTNPHRTEKSKGNNTEDKTVSEGTVLYDIQFDALLPHTKDRARLIINLEAQADFTPTDKKHGTYHLVTRGVYYCARMISAQKGIEFTGSQYENIAKVYSIWICMSPSEEWRGAVNSYSLAETNLCGEQHEDKGNYDKLCVILLCLGENSKIRESELIAFLNTLLSDKLSKNEKSTQLEEQFGFQASERLEGRLNEMCNYSKFVADRGEERGMAKGMAQGEEKATIGLIQSLMQNTHVTADKAMEMLGISPADRAKYKAQLVQ